MIWSRQQDAALLAVDRWLKTRHSQVFRLFGFAGTGKTTLAKTIASNVPGTVLFAAYTGKAALVLKSKGCTDARTIHSLIYRLDDENRGDPTFKLNRQSDVRNAALVIIDECSMVDEKLGRDLLSFGTPILVLGDPAQLPPVQNTGGVGFFTEHRPNVMLTEIHRQATDNPIIYLAQEIREGRGLQPGTYGESRVLAQGTTVPSDDTLAADQVLVGVNATRKDFNRRFREALERSSSRPGYSETMPVVGDRLVCLRNNREKGLLNGSLWDVKNHSTPSKHGAVELIIANSDDASEQQLVRILDRAFQGEEIGWDTRRHYDDFDFGYVLTVHKAQGSQWNDVIVFDQSKRVTRGDPEASRQWLYTAVTRAAEKVTVVL